MPYLVCDKCGSYYELQPDESPNDFTDKCECGGNLKYVQNLNNVNESQKICPNCGNNIRDDDKTCPICGFELKTEPATEKQLIFGFLWYIPLICFSMVGSIASVIMLTILFASFIFQPSLNIYSVLWPSIFVFLFTSIMLAAVVVLIKRFHNKYLKWYEKENLNWTAFIVSFVVTLIIGVFGGKYLPNNLSLIGPVIGGFFGGLIVGNRYIDGIVNGGISAGIAASIGFLIVTMIFGIELNNLINDMPHKIAIWIIGLLIIIIVFQLFYIMGSISGIIGVAIKKKLS